jgi:hypothetical protein
MAFIDIPNKLNKALFAELKRAWDDHDDVLKNIPEDLTSEQANDLAGFLLGELPDEFAFSVLADLIESYESLSSVLLERVFAFNDSGCNFSICLKSNLSARLRQLCAASTDPLVKSHFDLVRKKPNES